MRTKWIAIGSGLTISALLILGAVFPAPLQRNQFSTNVQGQPVIGTWIYSNAVVGGGTNFFIVNDQGINAYGLIGQTWGLSDPHIITTGDVFQWANGFGALRTNGSIVNVVRVPNATAYKGSGTSGQYVDIWQITDSTGNAVTSVSSNGVFMATNGFASFRSNSIAPFSFTFPATTVNWTNPINSDIEVYIDNSGVTGTSFKKNGTQIFSSLVGDVTVGLQPGEYLSATYSVGVPVARWSPR